MENPNNQKTVSKHRQIYCDVHEFMQITGIRNENSAYKAMNKLAAAGAEVIKLNKKLIRISDIEKYSPKFRIA